MKLIVLSIVLSLLLAVSVTVNVLQGRRILQQVDENAVSGNLKKGRIVPDLAVKDLAGVNREIEYGAKHKPTVLYVFRPSCVWCERNKDSINALIEQTGTKYDFVGISLTDEGIEEFAARHHPRYPIYKGISEEMVSLYRLGTTPETIVVSPNHVVLASWAGAYSGSTSSSIENFFSVKLPGFGL